MYGIDVTFDDKVDCTPMYEEVKRVWAILNLSNDEDELKSVKIDESVVPEDLVDNLKEYQQMVIDLIINQTLDDDTFDSRYKSLEPLYGLIKKDPNNKYFYEIAKVKLPYYIYEDLNKSKIRTLGGFQYLQNAGGYSPAFDEITVLTLDENYTVLNKRTILPTHPNAKIIFPNTLKTIKEGAFLGSTVTKIELPSSVETIEENAFQFRAPLSASRITEIIIKKEKGSIPGEPWGLDPDKTTIIWQPE